MSGWKNVRRIMRFRDDIEETRGWLDWLSWCSTGCDDEDDEDEE